MARPTRPATRRAGAVSVAALLVVPVLLLLFGLVVFVAQARDAKAEVQHGADAAALAAARALADDDLLRDPAGHEADRRARAREAADRLVGENYAQGKHLSLRPNPDNKPDGDLVFGRIDGPFSPFKSDDEPATAVQVTLAGPKVRDLLGGTRFARNVPARAAAYLDFAVTGFRPLDAPAPVVPLALFTDHTGKHPNGWDARHAAGRDDWRREGDRWAEGPDGVPEVVVVIGRRPESEREVPAAFVRLGTDRPAEAIAQVCGGVAREQCEKMIGGLGFAEHNTLTVAGSHECPSESDPGRGPLLAAFAAIVGEPRAWPLYSAADPDTGRVRVTGWVGARLVAVGPCRGGLRLVLQPAVVHHPSVVTDPERADRPGFWAANRTVCRVRLAE